MKHFILDKEDLKMINKWIREQEAKDDSNYVSGERWTIYVHP